LVVGLRENVLRFQFAAFLPGIFLGVVISFGMAIELQLALELLVVAGLQVVIEL
jgi:hypothetical protein